MAIKREKDVVELQITAFDVEVLSVGANSRQPPCSPVNNSLCVEVLQRKKHLACVKLGLTQGELLLLDVQHEIASADILHDKVDPSFGLEARVQAEQEGVALLRSSQKDTLFGLRAEGED